MAERLKPRSGTGGNQVLRNLGLLRQRYIDNFVFIHINKTGGTSIDKALKLPLEHKTALEKIGELGRKEWDHRFTFAVVRNPWDKVVSHYHNRLRVDHQTLKQQPIDFKEWVKLAYGMRDPRYYDRPRMFMPQVDWICDEQGTILVNFVCHFENLNQDFEHVCRQLGKKATLPHLKASKRDSYQKYYDDETIAIVAHWFAEDIKRFNYLY